MILGHFRGIKREDGVFKINELVVANISMDQFFYAHIHNVLDAGEYVIRFEVDGIMKYMNVGVEDLIEYDPNLKIPGEQS